MTTVDPSTGRPLPAEAIQRVLFVASSVHVYSIPPLTSTKGYMAASWTAPGSVARHIFTARLRIIETAVPSLNSLEETVKMDIVLEDPGNGQLFAAAPYTDVSAVEQVLDSSRFFAIRVVDGGRKAMLGIGFEERSEAFDFGISLQEVRKVQSLDKDSETQDRKKPSSKGAPAEKVPERKDFSLKEGQTISIDMGKISGRRREGGSGGTEGEKSGSWIAPPSGGTLGDGSMSFLPPPPSAQEMKAENRKSRQNLITKSSSIVDVGFDDGEFGEFQ